MGLLESFMCIIISINSVLLQNSLILINQIFEMKCAHMLLVWMCSSSFLCVGVNWGGSVLSNCHPNVIMESALSALIMWKEGKDLGKANTVNAEICYQVGLVQNTIRIGPTKKVQPAVVVSVPHF